MPETTTATSARNRISGRVVPVRGNDIDTDRIIPARFLRTVTFDGLGEHAFEDDRASGDHPFDNPSFAGARVLVANENFGCGSSREHAPQSLREWGIEIFIAQSFAEIFFGNSTNLGIPCVSVSRDDRDKLVATVKANPQLEVTVDVEGLRVHFGEEEIPCDLQAGARDSLLEGRWDPLEELLGTNEEIAAVAQALPYT